MGDGRSVYSDASAGDLQMTDAMRAAGGERRQGAVLRLELVDPPPVLMDEIPDRVVAEQPFVHVCIVDEAPNHTEMPR
jgi:hypothetical protein